MAAPVRAWIAPISQHVVPKCATAAVAWAATAALCLGLGFQPQHAQAALFQTPPSKLNNSYWLVRAGESVFEERGIVNTNPVRKTAMDSGLSDRGRKQSVRAAKEVRASGACQGSCWIWPSINQRAYQTAEIIALFNDVDRSKIVPEYSFLDARGLGALEGRHLDVWDEVHEMDLQSSNWRPPAFFDGTPNESVADVYVRITQLMSVLETQYSGATIVIVSPDSDNLSVLQAALTGLDLRRHAHLAFSPGEVRPVETSSIPPPRPPLSGLLTCSAAQVCR